MDPIIIDDVTRITVEVDEDRQECPLEWTGGGVISYRAAYHAGDLTIDPAGTIDTVRTIADHVDDEDALEGALQRHYARQGYAARTLSLTGYSQGEWHDVVVYVPEADAAYLDGSIDALQAWYRGDVFIVSIERLETWTSARDETMTTWELVGSVGGCYADTEDEFVSIARELEGYPVDA